MRMSGRLLAAVASDCTRRRHSRGRVRPRRARDQTARACGRASSPRRAGARIFAFNPSGSRIPAQGRDPLRVGGQTEGFLGSLTGQQTIRDGNPGDDPLVRRGWQADEAWKLSLAGPFYAYGQFSAGAEDALHQDARVNGRTGLAWQVPISTLELLVRGGPTVAYTDPLRPERMKEKSELLLEVQGRCPLLFGVHLEYQGSATPAVSPLERDWISHELHLALPVGIGRHVQIRHPPALGKHRRTTEHHRRGGIVSRPGIEALNPSPRSAAVRQ